MKKNYLLLLLAILLPLACHKPAGSNKTIMVTIEPLRCFTQTIAGNGYNVQTLVPVEANPETYEPTAQQLVALSNSKACIEVGGLGFERQWSAKLQQNAPDTRFVISSRGIKLLDNGHGATDPHVWMSARNAVVMATNICKELSALYPNDSVLFHRNLRIFSTRVRLLQHVMNRKLKDKRGTAFLIYHPTLTYFAHDYGLRQLYVENEGREPTAASTLAVINEARRLHVKTYFVQRQFSNRNTGLISHNFKVKQVLINPLSADWFGEMHKISNAI